MKIASAISVERANWAKSRLGLTILEMLVSTAMLALIMLGLTAMFIQTQKAFKTGIKQNTITDAGRTVTDMVGDDLRNLADAQNSNVVNLYWGWVSTNQVEQTNYNGLPLRTNQLDTLFILERTNNVWSGVGYAVSNVAKGVGTLYRYYVNTNGPLLSSNGLFIPFSNDVFYGTFLSTNWHRLVDGVVHMKVRAFDQYGNENLSEAYYGDYPASSGAVRYSFFYPSGYPLGITNALPTGVELELGFLEPDTLNQLRSLPPSVQNGQNGQTGFIVGAATREEIFRERITIPDVVR